jgi:hypothetical protein
MTLKLCTLVVASLLVTASHADYTLLGVGALSCGSFLKAVSGTQLGQGQGFTDQNGRKFSDESRSYSEWVQGFLSAINALNSAKENSHQLRPDYPGLDLWLRKWCEANPTEPFEMAVWAFALTSGAAGNSSSPTGFK